MIGRPVLRLPADGFPVAVVLIDRRTGTASPVVIEAHHGRRVGGEVEIRMHVSGSVTAMEISPAVGRPYVVRSRLAALQEITRHFVIVSGVGLAVVLTAYGEGLVGPAVVHLAGIATGVGYAALVKLRMDVWFGRTDLWA